MSHSRTPTVRLTLLRRMDMGSLTCAQIWVRAIHTALLSFFFCVFPLSSATVFLRYHTSGCEAYSFTTDGYMGSLTCAEMWVHAVRTYVHMKRGPGPGTNKSAPRVDSGGTDRQTCTQAEKESYLAEVFFFSLGESVGAGGLTSSGGA